ncbi:MAG: hypothetical protein R2734_19420 [Nocardioides sp.]
MAREPPLLRPDGRLRPERTEGRRGSRFGVGLTATPDGADCGQLAFAGASPGEPELTSGGGRSKPACAEADRVYVYVAQLFEPARAQQLQLVIYEEPPLTNAEQMPPDSGSVAWAELPDPVARAGEATAVTAGFGYADAPELADGVFRVHVDPSRGGLVKLPVSWGQHAQLALRPTRSYDDLWASLTARWFGPLGGEVKGLTQPGDTGLVPLVKDADGAHLATPTVRWRARPARYAAAAALPGPYFLQLYAPAYDGAPELPPGASTSWSARPSSRTSFGSPRRTSPTRVPRPTSTARGGCPPRRSPPRAAARSRRPLPAPSRPGRPGGPRCPSR